MNRSTHPLVRALRRLLRNRQSEAGDTLIEILITVAVLGGCAVALIITFGTAISASADHRSLVSNATVLRNVEQAAYYQLALQPTPLFTACATTTSYSSINYGTPTGYTASMPASPGVEYWNATTNSFGSSCPAANAPQLITINLTNPNGSNATTQFVVDGVGILQTPVTVTAVSPNTASQGTSNLLLTVTGTGFQAGATVSFPSASQISVPTPGTATFVSSTTLEVFVNVPATSPPASYDVIVTNPLSAPTSSTSPLFTVLPTTPTGMHVSTMVSNVGDPVVDDTDEDENSGWDAWDTMTIESGSGAPLAGVVVNGTWSVATIPGHTLPTLPIGTNTTSCTTDSTGTCTVYYGWRDVLHFVSATFTVSTSTSTNPAIGGLVLNGYTYLPSSNNPGADQIFAPCYPSANGC
jgi:type II secretory pathway pseudopilin PulG